MAGKQVPARRRQHGRTPQPRTVTENHPATCQAPRNQWKTSYAWVQLATMSIRCSKLTLAGSSVPRAPCPPNDSLGTHGRELPLLWPPACLSSDRKLFVFTPLNRARRYRHPAADLCRRQNRKSPAGNRYRFPFMSTKYVGPVAAFLASLGLELSKDVPNHVRDIVIVIGVEAIVGRSYVCLSSPRGNVVQ